MSILSKRHVIALILLVLPLFVETTMGKGNGMAPTEKVNKRKVGAIEGGVQIGLDMLVNDNEGFGWNLGAEMRYNLRSVPVDIGLLADVSMLNNAFNVMWQLELLSDYNFRQTSKFSPFLGCGIGIGGFDGMNGSCCSSYNNNERSIILSPRAGVEVLKFLRLTCMLNMPCSDIALTHVAFSVGLCLGGKNRRH